MVNYYDELEIEDFAWDPDNKVFHFPCPCGDRFEISKAQLREGEEIATCPSCSLIVRVIYDYVCRLSFANGWHSSPVQPLTIFYIAGLGGLRHHRRG
jgi:diphthamide biosynthesis protein 3